MVNKKSLATFVRTLGNQVIAGFKHFLNNVKIGGDLIHDPDPLGSAATNVLTVDAQGVVRKATSVTGGLGGGTVTSVALTAPSAFTVTGSPITTSGTIAIGGAGTASQYVRGDGQLADFPTSGGGGSSVSYYLNGSVNQGTFGGNVYREFNKTPIVGAGTDFTIAANGYIAQFITDANDPSLLEIPGGNWNIEFWFSASSNGGSPSFYVELSKYNGTTFTPIASNSAFPEFIAFGTITSQYYTALAVPQTTLAITDRLALRVYVIHSGRTITLHTEDNHLCQVITTFSTGLNALNGLTKQVQYFATGTSGADFNISSVTDTHTFNIPTASAINRGALSSADWTNFTAAYNDKINSAAVTGTTTKTLTLTQQDGGTITASWTDYDTAPVTSVFGRTGAVIAVGGDYNTSQVTENTNLYFTNARARTAISLTTTGTSGAATYDNATGVLNVPQYQSVLTNPVTGTGTTNYVTKWTSASAINNSQIFDDGTNVGIGTTSLTQKFHVNGNIVLGDVLYLNSANGAIWNSANGALRFGTNATERARFDAAGNFGIGTTSPSSLLEIAGVSPVLTINRTSGTTSTINFNSSGSNFASIISNPSSGENRFLIGPAAAWGGFHTFYTDTSERMRITASGNVGIGTISPAVKLEVVANGESGRFNSSDANGSFISFRNNGTARGYIGSGFHLWGSPNNIANNLGIRAESQLDFGIGSSVSMTINSSANVGIGTTTPGAKLDVTGIARATSLSTTSGLGLNVAGYAYLSQTLSGVMTFLGHNVRASDSVANTAIVQNASWISSLIKMYYSDGITFHTDSTVYAAGATYPLSTTERLRITPAGNVGIGTTNPIGRFSVVGSAIGAGILDFNTDATRVDIQSYNKPLAINRQGNNTLFNEGGGNVGIGTTTPNGKLQVDGDFYVNGLDRKIMNYNGAVDYGTLTNNSVRFNQNGAEIARISTAGNVGIGTTSPSVKLHTVGDGLFFSNTNTNLTVNSNGGVATLTLTNAAGSQVIYGGVGGSNNMDFYTGSAFRMRINPTGNVGIGTTSPSQRLHVSSTGETTLLVDSTSSGTARINLTGAGGGSGAINSTTGGLYLYASGANIMTLNTNGSERLRITSAGSVGIGTTSPVAPLTVVSQVNNGSAILTIRSSDNMGYSFARSNTTGFLEFDGNQTGYIGYVFKNGNVGIGTTAPSGKLQVGTYGTVTAPTYSTANGDGLVFDFFNIGSPYTRFGRIISSAGDTSEARLSFFTKDLSANPTEKVTILGNGNVGIGTTNPVYPLDIVGFANSSSGFRATNGTVDNRISWSSGNVGFLGTISNHPIALNTNATERVRITEAGNVGIGTTSPAHLLDVSGTARILNGIYFNNASGSFLWETGANALRFGTNNAERMRIDASGNVGIGTTSPAYKLDVNGGFRVDGTNGDFVVDPNGNDIYFTRNGANYFYGTQASSSFAFYTNSNLGLFQSSAGNVGIGTTSPTYKFNVVTTAVAGRQNLAAIDRTAQNFITFTNPQYSVDASMGLMLRVFPQSDSRQGAGIIASGGALNGETDLSLFVSSGTGSSVSYGALNIKGASGNVGIGTTAPGGKIHVVGISPAMPATSGTTQTGLITRLQGSGTNIILDIGNGWLGGNWLQSTNLADLSSTYPLLLNPNGGNVGIGTTSPNYPIDLQRTTSPLTLNLKLNKSSTTNDYAEIAFQLWNGAGSGENTFGGVGTSRPSIVLRAINENGTSAAGAFVIGTFTGGADNSTLTEKFRITSAGNVGIGTTSPGASIHVAGAINSTPTGDGFLAGIQSGYAVIHLNGSAATGSLIDFSVSGTDTKGRILYDNINNYFGFNTNGAERLKITSTGDVGIGTSSPSAKLHVIGNATVSSTLATVNAKITGTLTDYLNQPGTAGQVLSSTGTGIEWITGGGGGGGSTIIVKDEGTTIGSSFTTLNFVGNNIQASASGSTAVVTAYNNAGTGSLYANDTTTQFAPGASFADVEINAVTVYAAAPDTADNGQKLIAIVTFGVDNVSTYEGFNNFEFRLYNSSSTTAVPDTTHSWSSYMSKDAGVKKTVFTFHIPLYDGVGATENISVQAKQSTAYTPEIYYCALTFIEGTN